MGPGVIILLPVFAAIIAVGLVLIIEVASTIGRR